MHETTKTNLMRPSDVEVEREAAELQGAVLRFRFENYRSVESGPLYGDEFLRPRSRDLLRALAAHICRMPSDPNVCSNFLIPVKLSLMSPCVRSRMPFFVLFILSFTFAMTMILYRLAN